MKEEMVALRNLKVGDSFYTVMTEENDKKQNTYYTLTKMGDKNGKTLQDYMCRCDSYIQGVLTSRDAYALFNMLVIPKR